MENTDTLDLILNEMKELIDSMNNRFDSLDERMKVITEKQGKINKSLIEISQQKQLDFLKHKIFNLEEELFYIKHNLN